MPTDYDQTNDELPSCQNCSHRVYASCSAHWGKGDDFVRPICDNYGRFRPSKYGMEPGFDQHYGR